MDERNKVIRTEHEIPSSDGKSKLHILLWKPEKEARAVLQISHGMIEHIGRYDEFARMLAGRGIAVAGHDHLGHGKTSKEEDYGYFADKKGDVCVVKDIRRVKEFIGRQYPGIPYFLMGHSMGSFFLRKYAAVYEKDGDGWIFMGTGDQPLPVLFLGRAVVNLTGRFRGWRYRSPLLHSLVLGSFDRKFHKADGSGGWISSDQEKVKEYKGDPMCSFLFTCGAYRDFFKVMMDLKRNFWLNRMAKDTPVLLLSGKEDPVGGQGKGVERVYKKFLRLGFGDVHMKLYENCRHEILNEKIRDQVYQDIYAWLDSRIKGAGKGD